MNLSLSSVDAQACHDILLLLEELSQEIPLTLGEETQKHLELQRERTQEKAFSQSIAENTNPAIDSSRNKDAFSPVLNAPLNSSLIRDFLNLIAWPQLLLFLLPAFALNFLAYLSDASFPSSFKAILLLTFTILPILFVSWQGFLVERGIRLQAKQLSFDILKRASLTHLTDMMHRLSKDFTTVCERISWYVHDLSWFLSLLLVGVGLILIQNGIRGLILVIFFMGGCGFVWRYFSPHITQARKQSIEGINDAIEGIENFSCFTPIFTFSQYRAERVLTNAMDTFEKTNVALFLWKGRFLSLVSLLSGLLIGCASALTIQNPSHGVMLLTSLLMVDTILVTLFQAASGFNAQKLSYERLTHFKEAERRPPLPITSLKESLLLPAFQERVSKQHYKSVSLKKGEIYSLVGDSGAGKTLYLKALSNLSEDIPEAPSPMLYINKESLDILQQQLEYKESAQDSLWHFIQEKISLYKIIALDESLFHFTIEEAKNLVSNLNILLKREGVSGLLVDHRFELDNTILLHHVKNVLDKEHI